MRHPQQLKDFTLCHAVFLASLDQQTNQGAIGLLIRDRSGDKGPFWLFATGFVAVSTCSPTKPVKL
jgi:hypothetical protein